MRPYRRNGSTGFYAGVPSRYVSYVYFGNDPQDGNYVTIRFKTDDPWDSSEEQTITFFGNAYGGSSGAWLLAGKNDSDKLRAWVNNNVREIDIRNED